MKLAGTVSATFEILDGGAVTNASATGVDPTVSSCMEGVIAGIEFPQPKGAGGVRVRFSLALAPPP